MTGLVNQTGDTRREAPIDPRRFYTWLPVQLHDLLRLGMIDGAQQAPLEPNLERGDMGQQFVYEIGRLMGAHLAAGHRTDALMMRVGSWELVDALDECRFDWGDIRFRLGMARVPLSAPM